MKLIVSVVQVLCSVAELVHALSVAWLIAGMVSIMIESLTEIKTTTP